MHSLKNHFLISVPHLKDPFFEKSVVYLCEHDEKGAMGLIINKAIKQNNITLEDSSSNNEFNKYLEQNYLYIGGPVLTDKVLFLHTNNEISKSVPISDKVSISGNIELLNSIQKSKKINCKLFLGHAGWSPGQLEREIENGDWLIQESGTDLIFEQEIENIWIMATNSLGIEIGDISNTSGYS
tara:strand:- start:564 stop:1112 length:549 start_codon:yes stop_codon:yes gene_type:complete